MRMPVPHEISHHQLSGTPSDRPLCIMLETSSLCNAGCIMCPRQHVKRAPEKYGLMEYAPRPANFPPTDTFHRILDQISPLMLKPFFSGEPFMHPNILGMCRECRAAFPGAVMYLNTNGSLIGDDAHAAEVLSSGINILTVSIEAHEAAQKTLRPGASFETVEAALLRMARVAQEVQSKTRLRVLHMRGPHASTAEINKSMERWRAAGFAVAAEAMSDIADQVHTEGAWRPRRSRCCMELWTNAIISWDGEVSPCCVDHTFSLSVGNVLQTPMRDIWRGPKMEALREAHREFNARRTATALPELCRACL